MPRLDPENIENEIDAGFAAQLKQWERLVRALPDGELRGQRAKVLLESDEGYKARLSNHTISVGGRLNLDIGEVDKRDIHAGAIKAELETHAENLIALTMPLYDTQPQRNAAMEGLRAQIKRGFADWLVDSGHATWSYGLHRDETLNKEQASRVVQNMCDDFAAILQSPKFLATLAQEQASARVAAQ